MVAPAPQLINFAMPDGLFESSTNASDQQALVKKPIRPTLVRKTPRHFVAMTISALVIELVGERQVDPRVQ